MRAESTPCSCFDMCSLQATAAFLKLVPAIVEREVDPWYGYFRAVYGINFQIPFRTSGVNFFYHNDLNWRRRYRDTEWPMASCSTSNPPGVIKGPHRYHLPRCSTCHFKPFGTACKPDTCARWKEHQQRQHEQHAKHSIEARQVIMLPNRYGTTSGAVVYASEGAPLVPDGAWLEVMRYANPTAPEGINGYGCWYWQARGSGIWVNVGAPSLRVESEYEVNGIDSGSSFAMEWKLLTERRPIDVGRAFVNGTHEVFPTMARQLGYTSVQIADSINNSLVWEMGPNKAGHPQLVLVGNECVRATRPIGVCGPVHMRGGVHADAPCTCDNSMPILNCQSAPKGGELHKLVTVTQQQRATSTCADLLLSCFVFNHSASARQYPPVRTRFDRFDIFMWTLSSYGKLPLCDVHMYVELAPEYKKKRHLLTEHATHVFGSRLRTLQHVRLQTQSQWRAEVHRILSTHKVQRLDRLVWYLGNDDHVFVDTSTAVFEEGLRLLAADPSVSKTLQPTHFTEGIRRAQFLGFALQNGIKTNVRGAAKGVIVDGSRVELQRMGSFVRATIAPLSDSVLVMTYGRLRQIISCPWSMQVVKRLDGIEVCLTGRHHNQTIYLPLREQCRKFDGYTTSQAISADNVPPLVLPPEANHFNRSRKALIALMTAQWPQMENSIHPNSSLNVPSELIEAMLGLHNLTTGGDIDEAATVLPQLDPLRVCDVGTCNCMCFKLCNNRDIAEFLSQVPRFPSPDSPWMGYLHAVYGELPSQPVDLSRFSFYYHNDDMWPKHTIWPMASCSVVGTQEPAPVIGGTVNPPLCPAETCSAWVAQNTADAVLAVHERRSKNANRTLRYIRTLSLGRDNATTRGTRISSDDIIDSRTQVVANHSWTEVLRYNTCYHEGVDGYGEWPADPAIILATAHLCPQSALGTNICRTVARRLLVLQRCIRHRHLDECWAHAG